MLYRGVIAADGESMTTSDGEAFTIDDTRVDFLKNPPTNGSNNIGVTNSVVNIGLVNTTIGGLPKTGSYGIAWFALPGMVMILYALWMVRRRLTA